MYKKCDKAKYTYSYKCEVETYVNGLAANELFKARLLKYMKRVIEILANPFCEVIRPLRVDHNLIEVNDGRCWSIKERRFLDDAIKDKDIGHVTPRAFLTYDAAKEVEPKYFKEILENSLSEAEIGTFCVDFLKLLNHNQKRHKDRVPCLIGAANSGKTSLFQPLLGLIHHSHIATISKQRVFNKAMINRFTELIFIDEASPSTLAIDDWKILTQGGYKACDVKYKTAKSFINRCPMLLTAQKQIEFGPDDQPAMDRRLRNYAFKSLPNPRKKAAEGLRKHPMECVVWASNKARPASDHEESSDGGSGANEAPQLDDGILNDEEKEALLNRALYFASEHVTISNDDRQTIVNAKPSLLFNNGQPWEKKISTTLFDVTMGSYDGAETCELVGCYLLAQLQQLPNIEIGLYRDDGLAETTLTPKETERIKKQICNVFKNNNLKITIEANEKVINFLEVTLDMNTEKFKPYAKPTNTLLYVHSKSNHPPSIIKNIPESINRRLSEISSDAGVFEEAAKPYQEALGKSGCTFKLQFKPPQTSLPKSNRSRNIIWFNPTYNRNVKSNIGRQFLRLIDQSFLVGHKLRKIFNRSTLKLSYSCMPIVT